MACGPNSTDASCVCTNGQCQRNCAQVPNSPGTNSGSDTCNCNSGFSWISTGTCLLNCSLIPGAAANLADPTSCNCNTGTWDPSTNVCSVSTVTNTPNHLGLIIGLSAGIGAPLLIGTIIGLTFLIRHLIRRRTRQQYQPQPQPQALALQLQPVPPIATSSLQIPANPQQMYS